LPSAAKKPCARPGCSHLVARGYCAECAPLYSAKVLAERRRPSAHKRGYTRQWSEYSRTFLRVNPICVGYPHGHHGERIVPSEVTDHIEAAVAHPELFWEPSNHQALCGDCNKRKAIELEGGLGWRG
jgi:5-methylcytosine-specific restriction protein A